MTHAAPIAATSTSPPRHGAGSGVGVCPTTKPFPGPAPGPLSTRLATLTNEVPCQARGGIAGPCGPRRVGLSASLLALLAAPTFAQVIPTGSPSADFLLSQAVAEHRVFVTCSALDPLTHQQVLTNWQKDTAGAVAILQTHKVPPEAVTAFARAAAPAALMPADDTPWAEVRGLCDTHPDWQQDYLQFNLTILELKLPGAFQ